MNHMSEQFLAHLKELKEGNVEVPKRRKTDSQPEKFEGKLEGNPVEDAYNATMRELRP